MLLEIFKRSRSTCVVTFPFLAGEYIAVTSIEPV